MVITSAYYCFLGPIAKAVNFGTLDGGYCSHSNDGGCGDATTNLQRIKQLEEKIVFSLAKGLYSVMEGVSAELSCLRILLRILILLYDVLNNDVLNWVRVVAHH